MERVTEYFSQLLDVTRKNSWVRNEELTFREIDEKEGYIRGTLALHGGYRDFIHCDTPFMISICCPANSAVHF
ncbi:MAG: hypothetical protein ABIN18_27600 [Pseudomonadota bacterium]